MQLLLAVFLTLCFTCSRLTSRERQFRAKSRVIMCKRENRIIPDNSRRIRRVWITPGAREGKARFIIHPALRINSLPPLSPLVILEIWQSSSPFAILLTLGVSIERIATDLFCRDAESARNPIRSGIIRLLWRVHLRSHSMHRAETGISDGNSDAGSAENNEILIFCFLRLPFTTTRAREPRAGTRAGTRAIPLFMNLFMVNMKLFMNQIRLCSMRVAARRRNDARVIGCLQFIATVALSVHNGEKFQERLFVLHADVRIFRPRISVEPSRKLTGRNPEWMLVELNLSMAEKREKETSSTSFFLSITFKRELRRFDRFCPNVSSFEDYAKLKSKMPFNIFRHAFLIIRRDFVICISTIDVASFGVYQMHQGGFPSSLYKNGAFRSFAVSPFVC